MVEDSLRRGMAIAIRTVLEEGMRRSDDPITYLRSAAEEIRQLVEIFEQESQRSRPEEGEIRALLVSEIEAATQDLIRRLHH